MTRRSNPLFAVLAALVVLSIAPSNAQAHEHGKKRKGPPIEAFDACAQQVEGAICVFPGRNDDQISGTCVVPRRQDSEALVCKPDERPPAPEDDERDEEAEQ